MNKGYQMFAGEYPLYTKVNAMVCPTSRYVGGVSGWLCECAKPLECDGVAVANASFEPIEEGKKTRKEIIFLKVSHGTSRGAGTYGQPITRLTDTEARKTYKVMGGGFDADGENLAAWLMDNFQAELLRIKDKSYYVVRDGNDYRTNVNDAFYGMGYNINKKAVVLNGGCGIDQMIRIAEAIGIEFQRSAVENGRRRGETKGWYVEFSK